MAVVNFWSIAFLTLCVGVIYMKYFRAKYCRSKVSLHGKTVVITGGNAGIGKETAVDLAKRGAKVILACRNPDKGVSAVGEVRKRSGNSNVVFRQLDLASPDSIRNFANMFLEEESRLDILINNAGISFGKPGVTVEGYDLIMWVNHFAPFLLTHLLLDRLKQCAPSRIITVSSSVHSAIKNKDEFFYLRCKNAPPKTKVLKMYGQTKLGNIIFTRELAKRLEGTGVTAYSLHPGYVHTNFLQSNREAAEGTSYRWMFVLSPFVLWPFMISPEAGAQTTIFCAITESITNMSGRYFTGCHLAKESDIAKDEGLAKKLWDLSMQVTRLEQ